MKVNFETLGLPASAVAVVYATSLAIVMLSVAPALEVQLRHEVGLSVGQVGVLFFVELAAMGLATFPACAWQGRVDETRVAQCAYGVFIAGSALSALLLNSFPLLVAVRGLTGLGAGTLMVLGMTAGARARDPNRMFATIAFGQLASGAIILNGLPALSVGGSALRGVFLLCALLGALGLLSTRPFAVVAHRRAPLAARPLPFTGPGLRTTLVAVAFALVFNTVVGGLWAFAGEYASNAGLSGARIAQVLTCGTLVGMAGAAAAFAIGERVARRVLLLAGFGLITVGSSVLHVVRGDVGFAAGCCILSFGWNFCVPFVLGAVAAQDPTGRAMSSMNLAFAFGLGIGPLFAAAVIGFAGLDVLAPCMLAALALGTLLMWRVT